MQDFSEFFTETLQSWDFWIFAFGVAVICGGVMRAKLGAIVSELVTDWFTSGGCGD